ncbi:hypothetical protein N7478_001550 [Penicillium angulare]|uniref:uncharacterized protein n=1 Tax=Penicillium angulare TaxID=116970 RepID=UPI002540D703|nr:uncharacterized protein N7478_001550 [Penicillium angulare]KAJ5288520.1 hypothetical protein N7478_001550 [Penicillium angulare]
MSAFNPFRRNLDGGAATATPPISASAAQSTNNSSSNLASNLTSNPPQPQVLPSQLPDDYPRKSSLSLEIQEEDDSTSSDEQTADPFNPVSSVSDNEDDQKPQNFKSSAPGDHPRASFGSTPHPAPSTDGSTTSPSEAPLATNEYYKQSTSSLTESSSDEDTSSAVNRSVGDSQHYKQSARLSSSGNKDKKPPPPPKSHHGKRINAKSTPAMVSAQSIPSRPTHRSSFHSSSPESFTSSHKASTPNASSAQRLAPDYFAIQSENQAAVASNGSLSRSDSQHKRPPTPPLSRRHSQMHRSKSTQSKSSASRLTLSSVDSESNDSSQPPSPGPSTRSGASSLSRDRKRVSMPPPSSGDFHPTISSAGISDHLSPPNSSQTSLPGRRASSYGNLATGSSYVAPPPPPPPRRARDSSARSHEGRPVSQMITTQEEPLPQPSNAIDILADLSRLQKEVDDLRGHYESRKVSE